MNKGLQVIDLLKGYITHGRCDTASLDEAQKTLALAIDESKVNNCPTDELESLYGTVLWLRCDILGL